MPRSDGPDALLPKILTPAGGMMLSILVGGMLWSGVALGVYVSGSF